MFEMFYESQIGDKRTTKRTASFVYLQVPKININTYQNILTIFLYHTSRNFLFPTITPLATHKIPQHPK